MAQLDQIGVLHRDLSSGNIVVSMRGGKLVVAKLIDYDLARPRNSPSGAAQITVRLSDNQDTFRRQVYRSLIRHFAGDVAILLTLPVTVLGRQTTNSASPTRRSRGVILGSAIRDDDEPRESQHRCHFGIHQMVTFYRRYLH